jgi:ribonuclease HI
MKQTLKGSGITINTDASYNTHKRGCAGYAFWIVCNLFKIQKGGMFKKREPANPIEAEIMCIGNAIATLLAQKQIPEVDWVLLNSDCVPGMDTIEAAKTPLGKQVKKLWLQLKSKTGAKTMVMRHVKAHTGANDPRSFVNEWCDKEAKKWMKISTKQKK